MSFWVILLLILKILAWILLGIVALVLVALIIPVTLEIAYKNKKLRIAARYLFLRFKIYGYKEKTAEKKAVDDKKKNIEEDVKDKDKKRLDFALIKRLLEPGWKSAWALLKRLKIRDVRVVIVAKGRDAAAVGTNAGRAWAALGAGMDIVNSIWKRVDYKEITVLPDFAGELDGDEKYSCKISSIPVIILVIGLDFLVKYNRITGEQADGQPPQEQDAEQAAKDVV